MSRRKELIKECLVTRDVLQRINELLKEEIDREDLQATIIYAIEEINFNISMNGNS